MHLTHLIIKVVIKTKSNFRIVKKGEISRPGNERDPQTMQRTNLTLNQCPGGFEVTTSGSKYYLET